MELKEMNVKYIRKMRTYNDKYFVIPNYFNKPSTFKNTNTWYKQRGTSTECLIRYFI